MAENLTLIIEQLPNGAVKVSGPIGQKALCYGLLECAKDAVRDFCDKQAQKNVIEIPSLIRKGRRTERQCFQKGNRFRVLRSNYSLG